MDEMKLPEIKAKKLEELLKGCGQIFWRVYAACFWMSQ